MTNFAIARRLYAGITSADLAARLGVTQSYISQLETGKRSVNRQNVQLVAGILDVSRAWLLEVPEAMPLSDLLSGDVFSAPIMRDEDIPGYGTIYHVWLDDAALIVPVILAGGVQMTPRDWQAPIPHTASEIGEHQWIGPRGQDCIMLDGLPRIIE